MNLKEILKEERELEQRQQELDQRTLELREMHSSNLIQLWLDDHYYKPIEVPNEKSIIYSDGKYCFAEVFGKWNRFGDEFTIRSLADFSRGGKTFPEAINERLNKVKEARKILREAYNTVARTEILGMLSSVGGGWGYACLTSVPEGIALGMLIAIPSYLFFKKVLDRSEKKLAEAEDLEKSSETLFENFNAVYDNKALEKLVEVCEPQSL